MKRLIVSEGKLLKLNNKSYENKEYKGDGSDYFYVKYDITKHPNYHLTADADERRTFDIEKYLTRDLKLRGNEIYEVVEVEV